MAGGAPIVGDTVALTTEEALEIAIGAARAAAILLVERFRGPAAGLRVKSSATDMVSEADERAERPVVYDPLRDELFSATRGGGARLGDRPLRVSEKADLPTALVATGFAYVTDSRRLQGRILAGVLGEVRDVRRLGSASLDLAYVASGRFDAYFESVDQPWDWMAGALLVREAGGRVSQLTPANPALPRIVASGSALHDALLELLTKATEAL